VTTANPKQVFEEEEIRIESTLQDTTLVDEQADDNIISTGSDNIQVSTDFEVQLI
jgi:hypothetical protein